MRVLSARRRTAVLVCLGFDHLALSLSLSPLFYLGVPFGRYRTAEQSLDEPPRWNPEMELLLICLSLWILQCNSARADSIIHIGKRPIKRRALRGWTGVKREACENEAQLAHTALITGFWWEGGINTQVSSHPEFKQYFDSQASWKVGVL